jgi:hypothetical protein
MLVHGEVAAEQVDLLLGGRQFGAHGGERLAGFVAFPAQLVGLAAVVDGERRRGGSAR